MSKELVYEDLMKLMKVIAMVAFMMQTIARAQKYSELSEHISWCSVLVVRRITYYKLLKVLR